MLGTERAGIEDKQNSMPEYIEDKQSIENIHQFTSIQVVFAHLKTSEAAEE